MIVGIAAPFVDTRPSDLRLHLDVPRVPAESTLVVDGPGVRIELRLLAASHQVVVDNGVSTLIETVACLPEVAGEPVTGTRDRVIGAWRHSIVSTTERFTTEDELARRVRLLVAQSASDRGLVGCYAGNPLATTGVRLDCVDEPAWQTWHSYPQTRQIVRTQTRLSPADAGVAPARALAGGHR